MQRRFIVISSRSLSKLLNFCLVIGLLARILQEALESRSEESSLEE